jgi:hypothetical protein
MTAPEGLWRDNRANASFLAKKVPLLYNETCSFEERHIFSIRKDNIYAAVCVFIDTI